ncbi:MAG: alpha/beta hydrolase [Gammaproteobacteria bacterium]|nr:alpha/beta hydrolase [Gammaproteobacteria bacterium]
MNAFYQPERPSASHDLTIGRIRYRCYSWGPVQGRPVWLLHGWADCALSFQPLIDQLNAGFRAFAADWRGFGETGRAAEHYWFPDYLADLETLLEVFSPGRTVALIGHSMGANVAALYAGIRPSRVDALVCLDAAGLPASPAALAPSRYAQWLDEIRVPALPRDFATLSDLVRQVRKLAPRADAAIATFVAQQWATRLPDGRYRLKMDPKHRRVNAILYRREEAMACWRNVTAPALFLIGGESSLGRAETRPELERELRQCFHDGRIELIGACGHMLHIEAPRSVAAALNGFLGSAG